MSDIMRVYVGTYAKYNNGNLYGAWLDIEDYSDKDEFFDACEELHKDESDPEFMFQDFENIPRDLIGESSIDDKVFELASMSDDDKEIWAAYMANVGECEFSKAQEDYRGTYDSGEAFAEDWCIETGMIDTDHPMFNYVDFEHYWKSDLSHSFFESNGHYFYNS